MLAAPLLPLRPLSPMRARDLALPFGTRSMVPLAMPHNCEMHETATTLEVQSVLPIGFRAEDAHVHVENSTLTISGEQHHEQETSVGAQRRVGSFSSSFSYSVVLPSNIREGQPLVSFDNGMVKILFQKEHARIAPAAHSTNIPVRV